MALAEAVLRLAGNSGGALFGVLKPFRIVQRFEISLCKMLFSALFREAPGLRFRVDLGGCPPRPPTDPYVRNSRIRFLRSRFRYATQTA
jgi:hypothetical protein